MVQLDGLSPLSIYPYQNFPPCTSARSAHKLVTGKVTAPSRISFASLLKHSGYTPGPKFISSFFPTTDIHPKYAPMFFFLHLIFCMREFLLFSSYATLQADVPGKKPCEQSATLPVPFTYKPNIKLSEYFNSTHIHVMCLFLYAQECLGKIFGVQRVADNFIFHINLSSCPLPSPHLNRVRQYPKSSIIVDSYTFSFSKYRGSLCPIQ